MNRHTVILGAGATIAAIPNGDKNGRKSSVMNGLIENLNLQEVLDGIEPKATILRIFIQSYIQDRNVDMQLRNWKNAYTSTLNLWNLLTNLQFMIFSFSV